ncbi:ASCH domain-containing protein [Pasteurella multocida]|uniref:ASCH domain-containing protein n=1 Tax=Pasteurella multocida TaxID=747 RepID=UPI00396A50ED
MINDWSKHFYDTLAELNVQLILPLIQEYLIYTNETDRFFANIKVLSVTPIHFEALSEEHAQQENMTLPELRQVIKEIYPQEDCFWVIAFELVD